MAASPATARAETGVTLSLRILPIAFVNFCTYLGVGLPLAVLPGFVIDRLGYGLVLAGLAVSIQFLTTVLSRPFVGRMSDRIGSRRTVLIGTGCALVSGLAMVATGLLGALPPGPLFAVLLVSRLVMGVAESCSGTATITWNIARLGQQHAARVMSWGGVAAYGAIAAGAPLGAALFAAGGLTLVGIAAVAAAATGLAIALLHAPARHIAGPGTAMGRTAGVVLPYGVALMLGAVGFGAVASFASLLFVANGWPGASLMITVFGAFFAGGRVVLGGAIDRLGGRRVAVLSLAAEATGLAAIWLAPVPALALAGAAVAGTGFGLVFPALGVEMLRHFPGSSRGAALGVYTVFLDAALVVTGPLAGLLVPLVGQAGIFAASGAAALLGMGVAAATRRLAPAGRAPAAKR